MTETTIKACAEYIRAARDVLGKIKYLTPADRMRLEGGINYLERGRDLFKNESPEALKEAAGLWLVGGYHLGAICVVSTSEKKYWNLKSHGPAGEASGRSRNKDADVWRAWVRQEITRLIETNPALAPDDLTENMRANKTAPGNLPSHDRLVRFIRKELKSRKAGKKNSLRLVG